MSNPVTYSRSGDVAILTMDDGKANALAPVMSEGLSAGLDRAANDAKAVIIRGRPGVLCGGYDLKIIRGEDAALRDHMRSLGTALLLRLYLSPQPIVFACTGHAVAAGALLLLTGDRRIGTDGDFKVGLNEVAIGLPLPSMGLELARDRLIPGALQQAAVMAKLYRPADAAVAGYLDETVAADDLDAKALEVAQQLAELDAAAFAQTKRTLRQPTLDRMNLA
jgi:enoyl-CoA hydratase